jgi:hypothetical protein
MQRQANTNAFKNIGWIIMNLKNTMMTIEQQSIPLVKKSTRRVMKSLEYELIAGHTLQLYQDKDQINFELLLSIPLAERIPGLIAEYGLKRMHKLLVMVIREFSMAIPLPKSKKLNDTRVSVCACDLMLTSYEDQLSLEDFILFFERAKAGKYGAIKKALTHQLIVQMLEQYRQERHEALASIRWAEAEKVKPVATTERICPEPTQIGELFNNAKVIDLTDFNNRKRG